LPWLFALCSAFVQAHGATTSGHFMWLAPIPWGVALMLAAADAPTLVLAVRRGALLSGVIGVVSSAHLWGIAFYAGVVYGVVLAYHFLAWGLVGGIATLLLRRGGAAAPLSIGALWALFETVRSLGALSFPFFFGGMLSGEPVIAQTASVVGAAGLSGLLFWVGFAAAGQIATLLGARAWSTRRHVLPAAVGVAVAASGGAWRLGHVPAAPRTLRVAALQGATKSIRNKKNSFFIKASL
jgi:apolipoprotein N-acyltransferase